MGHRRTSLLDNDSQNRADLAIFHTASAFVDSGPPFGAITLIEFKRPARTGYSPDKNPFQQVIDYVRDIREGKAIDNHSRPVVVPTHLPFYAYIICDPTPQIIKFAEDLSATRTPDELGFFGYNPNLRLYFELISYDKLIADAKKRHASFFDALKLNDFDSNARTESAGRQ
jgi:hypothetical protein